MKEDPRFSELVNVGLLWAGRISFVAVITLGLCTTAGLRLNVSRSLPLGLYQIVGDRSTVQTGSVVIVCLPGEWTRFARERRILGPGRCKGGSYGLGKIVLAAGGDTVDIRDAGLVVNGERIPNSRVLERDSRGRSVPHHPWGTYLLEPDQLWLFSPYHATSFDSRYFGPLTRSHVRAVVRPVLTE